MTTPPGRVRRAPENFLDQTQIAEVQAGRRDFLRQAFATAAAAGAPLAALAQAKGDPVILELPEHSRSLGQPVAARGYGSPSQHEKNLQRRESPGLTRVGASSVSFAPLQGLFGIITPTACTSSATTRAGGTSIPTITA
jgi:sulfane dehydrogenase subunit SoxC